MEKLTYMKIKKMLDDMQIQYYTGNASLIVKFYNKTRLIIRFDCDGRLIDITICNYDFGIEYNDPNFKLFNPSMQNDNPLPKSVFDDIIGTIINK
jgi:hypothetical protein